MTLEERIEQLEVTVKQLSSDSIVLPQVAKLRKEIYDEFERIKIRIEQLQEGRGGF